VLALSIAVTVRKLTAPLLASVSLMAEPTCNWVAKFVASPPVPPVTVVLEAPPVPILPVSVVENPPIADTPALATVRTAASVASFLIFKSSSKVIDCVVS